MELVKRACVIGLLAAAGAAAHAEVLEIAPGHAGDPAAALRLVNLSKMPVTVRSLSWRFAAPGNAAPCTAGRDLTLAVGPGESVLVTADNAAALLGCIRGGPAPRALGVAASASSTC